MQGNLSSSMKLKEPAVCHLPLIPIWGHVRDRVGAHCALADSLLVEMSLRLPK